MKYNEVKKVNFYGEPELWMSVNIAVAQQFMIKA